MSRQLLIIMSLIFLAACGRAPASTPLVTLPPTATSLAQATLPTAVAAAATATPAPTLTATPLPSPTPSPTPGVTATPMPTHTPPPTATATPVPLPTLIPIATNAISAGNASQVVELNRLGWGQVDRVRFSPDGEILAIATTLGIFLYDSNTFLPVQTTLVSSPIRAFNFSPDGQLMASGHDDRRVRLWRVSDGSLVRTLEGGHNGAVWSVAFSPDGALLATTAAAEDGLINLWQVEDGHLRQQISGHASRVRDVQFSPDGELLASASIDWTVRLWNVADGSQRHRLAGHQGPVWRLIFSADGQTLHSGGSQGELITWNVSSGTRLYQTQAHSFELIALAAWPSGSRVVTGSEDGDVFVWDFVNGYGELIDHFDSDWVIDDVAVSPDGATIAIAAGYGAVSVHALPIDPARTYPLPYDVGSIWNIRFAPDGQTILINNGNSLLAVSLPDFDPSAYLNQVWEDPRLLVDLAYTPDGQYILAAAAFKGMIWLDRQTYRELSTFPDTPRSINRIAVSQDGTKVAVAWNNGDVTLYPLTPTGLGAPIQTWVSGQSFYSAFILTFAAADSMLIWAIESELVRVDLATLTVLPALNDHRGRVSTIAASPVTPHWALAAADTVWLYHNDTPPIALTGHTQAATSIRFSPDGRLLATGDSRGIIRLWRVSDGRLLKTLTGHQQIITDLAFSPDGSQLLSGSQDRTVRFWGIP